MNIQHFMSHIISNYTGPIMKMDNIHCDEISDKISSDHCKIICLFLGRNPKSNQYGDMIGFFEYIDGRIFRFRFHVHKPNQKYAQLSNKMTNIEMIVEHNYPELNDIHYTVKDTDFGVKAFWNNTPTSSLENEDLDLRQLMQNLTKYSRKHNLCNKLRKTDKEHIAYEKSTN